MADQPPVTRWDERYARDEYVFGKEPNDFLAEVAGRLPTSGQVLCLADGEGRNGVYVASLGHQVTSVDASAVALGKAHRLATEKGVAIETVVADLNLFEMGENRWDCIVSIFFHMLPDMREAIHQKVERAIRPGGHLILEAYTPAQLAFRTGGPPMAERLMTLEDLRRDFPGLEFLQAQEKERDVYEGVGHAGHAAVVQLFARKP